MGFVTASFMNQYALMQAMNAQYGLIIGAQNLMALSNQASQVAMANPTAIENGYGPSAYMTSVFQSERALLLNQARQQTNLKMYEAMQESSKKLADKKASEVGRYLDVSG